MFGYVSNLEAQMLPNNNIDTNIIDTIRQKGYKILVIDDDNDFRRSFSFKLRRKFGAHVEEVASGKAAVEKLRAGTSYELIFIDIIMPEMTGVDTYHEIRKCDANVQIVIMSAYSDSTEWTKAAELNDVILLRKPINDTDLIEALVGSAED